MPRHSIKLLMLGVLSFLSGCGEDRGTPTEAAPVTVRPSFHAGNSQGEAKSSSARAKNKGQSRAYAVRVNRGVKRIEITTRSLSYCDPEVDPHCEQECDVISDFCASAEIIDEALDGGQVGVGDVSATSEGAECPETINGGIWFSWRGHSFVVWGVHTRQRVLRTWPWGEAEYALPPGPHESQDGKAIIWNGVLKGKCFGYTNRYGEFEGIISFFWVRGEAKETGSSGGTGGGSGGEEGWEYYTVSNGSLTTTTNGISTGDREVDAVINKWLETGECSDGWVIIVDGQRVC